MLPLRPIRPREGQRRVTTRLHLRKCFFTSSEVDELRQHGPINEFIPKRFDGNDRIVEQRHFQFQPPNVDVNGSRRPK